MKRERKYKKALWTTLPGRFPTGVVRSERRTRIRSVSKRQSKRNREYLKVRKEFLQHNPKCQAECHWPSVEVHHTRGKIGPLLCDTRFFLAVCRRCHDWIGVNIEAARAKGWICAKGLWNKPT